MTVPGVFEGIENGLKGFDGRYASSVLPIADFDFSKPVTAYDFSSAYATDEWTLSGPTAGKYANGVGTATLDNTGGLEDQEAIGLFNGTDPVSIKAWESKYSSTDKLAASDTTTGDVGSADFCIRLKFRINESQSAKYLIAKSQAGGGNPGWDCIVQSDDTIDVRVRDGTNTGIVTLTGNYFDGAWHYITWWFDWSTKTLFAKGDLDSEVSQATSIASAISSSSGLAVGAFHSAATGDGLSFQARTVSLCSGANAQSMYDAADADWKHATDPTGLLETVSRASSISIPVSASRVAHFGVDQLPIGYHSAFDAGTYALYCNSDVTNLLTYSELLSNWSNKSGTPTVTDKDGDDPAGFRRATSIVATANNDQLGLNFTTTASTEYTIGVQLKRKGGSDVTGRVIFYDETGAAELAAQAFTATADYNGWVTVTATTNVGQVSSSIRIEIDTSGEGVFASFAQANAGEGIGAYIRTEAATASLVECDYARDTEDSVTTDEGELLAVLVRAVRLSGVNSILLDGSAATFDDHRRALFNAGSTFRAQLRLGGTSEADYNTGVSTTLDTKYTYALQWGNATDDEELRQIIDSTAYDSGSTMPYENTATGAFESLAIGNSKDANLGMNGWIQSIKSYDQIVSEAA